MWLSLWPCKINLTTPRRAIISMPPWLHLRSLWYLFYWLLLFVVPIFFVLHIGSYSCLLQSFFGPSNFNSLIAKFERTLTILNLALVGLVRLGKVKFSLIRLGLAYSELKIITPIFLTWLPVPKRIIHCWGLLQGSLLARVPDSKEGLADFVAVHWRRFSVRIGQRA